MKHLLKNPFVMGACGGVLATCVHFINQKIVKKQSQEGENKEDSKTEPLEYAKIFVLMTFLVGGTVFFMNKKNTLFNSKLLGGGGSAKVVSSLPSTGNVPVTQAAVPVNTAATTVRQTTSVNPVNMRTGNSATMSNVNLNMTGGGQTISSAVNPSLELSDINDVIHTGIPNF